MDKAVAGRSVVFVANLSPAVVDDDFTTGEVLDDLLGARCSAFPLRVVMRACAIAGGPAVSAPGAGCTLLRGGEQLLVQ